MFWDTVSPLYDFFETIYNKRVYTGTGTRVAALIDPDDEVLECACGTGAISVYIAQKCKKLIATDYAVGDVKAGIKKVPYVCKRFVQKGRYYIYPMQRQ